LFSGFFYFLKQEGIPVSLNEWMMLMEALDKGLAQNSLLGFYYLARALLVKSEAYYDRFDQAFQQYFKGIEASPEIAEKAMKWLERSLPPLWMDPAQREKFSSWDLDTLRKKLAELLAQQTGEHHGGSRWIGTGGTSPFGHSGYHPAGVRIGGESLNLSAVKVAAERRYRDFRNDETLNTRHFELALRKLRTLGYRDEGPKDELDLENTIDATCRNAGYLKIIWTRPRKNTVKLLVLMDSGGSMDPYARLCAQLFNAVHKVGHFKDLKFYYFHNCVYEKIYLDPYCYRFASMPTSEMLQNLDQDYYLIIVGDASMAASELLMVGGVIDWYDFNGETGLSWLEKLATHFTRSVWLNPVPQKTWTYAWGNETIKAISRVFPMFELTVEGLEQAVKKLKVRR
jgi:hypothetical protein